MINDRLVLIGFAALSAVATAGCVRQTPAVRAVRSRLTTAARNFDRVRAACADHRGPHVRTPPLYDDRRVYDVGRSNRGRTPQQSSAAARCGRSNRSDGGGGKERHRSDYGGASGRPMTSDRTTVAIRIRTAMACTTMRAVSEPERTAKERAAIIGGSAAAGAAIGGIAGGGKGAAIGALGGGAAGYIYDRMTKNQ